MHQIGSKNVEHSFDNNEGLLNRDYVKSKQLPNVDTFFNHYGSKSFADSDNGYFDISRNNGQEVLTPMLPPNGNQDSNYTDNIRSDKLPATQLPLQKNSLSTINFGNIQESPDIMNQPLLQKNRSSSQDLSSLNVQQMQM